MQPILDEFANNLMDKNVAKDVAADICQQVETSLLNTKTSNYTSVTATIKESLMVAIEKLLTPKRNIDVLNEALTAKK